VDGLERGQHRLAVPLLDEAVAQAVRLGSVLEHLEALHVALLDGIDEGLLDAVGRVLLGLLELLRRQGLDLLAVLAVGILEERQNLLSGRLLGLARGVLVGLLVGPQPLDDLGVAVPLARVRDFATGEQPHDVEFRVLCREVQHRPGALPPCGVLLRVLAHEAADIAQVVEVVSLVVPRDAEFQPEGDRLFAAVGVLLHVDGEPFGVRQGAIEQNRRNLGDERKALLHADGIGYDNARPHSGVACDQSEVRNREVPLGIAECPANRLPHVVRGYGELLPERMDHHVLELVQRVEGPLPDVREHLAGLVVHRLQRNRLVGLVADFHHLARVLQNLRDDGEQRAENPALVACRVDADSAGWHHHLFLGQLLHLWLLLPAPVTN